jgi:hypothetical protein
MFAAAVFVACGCLFGFLGVFGAVLVRVRPETRRNINYDPSTIALFAPIPLVIGLILFGSFIRHARHIDR